MLRRVFLILSPWMLLAGAAGGIRWTPPKSWKAQPERPMRAATYTVPAAPGDAEPGECAVFYFGPGQGGGVDENIRRWIGQFSAVDGKPATRAASVRGMKVTHIDVSGSYAGMGGPMAPARTPKPGYRLLGAIIEGPEGAVFFKLTGPAKTVAAARAEFEAMIESAAKG